VLNITNKYRKLAAAVYFCSGQFVGGFIG